MPLDLTKVLVNGLAPDEFILRDQLYAQVYRGLRTTPYGARQFAPITEPIDPSEFSGQLPEITKSPPFPQLIRGKAVTLLADRNYVYEVDESDWSLTKLTLYDLYDQGNTVGLTPGGVWHFADFFTTWMLFNGSCVLIKSKWYDSSKVFCQNLVSISTGLAWRGRLYLAGFDSSNFWSNDWRTLWQTFCPKSHSNWGQTLTGPGPNWVWWSSIGGGDLLFLFDPELAKTGSGLVVDSAHSVTRPLEYDYLIRNQRGALPMDWRETVLKLGPLRDFIVVYGGNGISALTPSSQTPSPTLGKEEGFHEVGLLNRGAEGGDYRNRAFIDTSGTLWMIDGRMQVTRKGYKNYFSSLLSEDCIINYDPHQEEFYITFESEAFLLTKSGLSRRNDQPTSVYFVDGGLIGVTKTSEVLTGFEVETLPLSLSTRKTKTIKELEIGRGSDSALTAIAKARDTSGTWSQVASAEVDKRGVAPLKATGVELVLGVSGSTAQDLDLLLATPEEAKEGLKGKLDA